MKTLLDLLPRMRQLGDREAVTSFDGFRTRKWSYRELYGRAGAVAEMLRGKGLRKGDRVLLWGENCGEWVAAFWGCLACGLEVVPVDYQRSPGSLERIREQSGARCLIHGGSVDPEPIRLKERLAFATIREALGVEDFRLAEASGDDVVDILYTSGTTGEPRGVIHRHRNICANLRPVQREVDRYIRWARPFQPIRFLDLVPMSHVFGQAMGLFAPVILGGAAVFTTDLQPRRLIALLRRERITVMVAVPRMLDSLRSSLERRFDLPDGPNPSGALGRIWRNRNVHREFGWKFWAFLVGGARLDPELESFWSRQGFLVMQGYGLTETSAVVAVNHPFRASRGSLGQVLPGQEVRIAADGEILVRGENVVAEYLGGGHREPAADEEGWFHTGDLGSLDDRGRLHYRGRKKDLIVTSEGLNVHPEDVESVLAQFDAIRDSVVVARKDDRGEHVHAAVIPTASGLDPAPLVEEANKRLEPYQRIRSWSVWPGRDFPRTSPSLKVRRGEVARRLFGEQGGTGERPPQQGIEDILRRLTGPAAGEIRDDTRLVEDIGLSSLERIDVLSSIEDVWDLDLDEEALAGMATVGELRRWIESEGGAPPAGDSSITPARTGGRGAHRRSPGAWQIRPRWTRSLPVGTARRALQAGVFAPLFRHYTSLRVRGAEHLDAVSPPVIFAANHESQLDTMAILAALPPSWRRRVAPAMSQEYFRAYLEPSGSPWAERLSRGAQFVAAAALFHAYPLPHSVGNLRESLRHTAELLDLGYCPLVYPEGRRSHDGRLHPFRPGVGLMSSRLGAPVVPVCLTGMFEILPADARWPKRGAAGVEIGEAIQPQQNATPEAITEQIERAIRNMRSMRDSGTAPPKSSS